MDVCNQRTACTPHLSAGAEHERPSRRCRNPVLKGHDPIGFSDLPGGPGSGRVLPERTDHPAGCHPLRTGFHQIIFRAETYVSFLFLHECINCVTQRYLFVTVLPYMLYRYRRFCDPLPPLCWVGAIIPCP